MRRTATYRCIACPHTSLFGRKQDPWPDLDIYRSANILVKQHGQDAPIHAAMRADAMLDKGYLDGYSVWKRIIKAVEDLQRAEPRPGGKVH